MATIQNESLLLKQVNRQTTPIRVGKLLIGAGHPIAVQSMCATRTQDIVETLEQIRLLKERGAAIIRVAVDSKRDVAALQQIRKETDACLAVDLQENYRLARDVAPLVQKIRYNPGHLHHIESSLRILDKVDFLTDCAGQHGCAIRVGVNFGSLDPLQSKNGNDPLSAALNSAAEHIAMLERFDFRNYLVSLKSSDPEAVVMINKRFAHQFPEVPLHLGVTEAGPLPIGEWKTRYAFEQLLSEGIGDTIRVSLTLPHAEKYLEVQIGEQIIRDVAAGILKGVENYKKGGLNIISCPSCSRVENSAFIELAEKVRSMAQFAAGHDLTIAVMGCRVNGPGESDEADLGLWCAAGYVNLKKRGQLIGAYRYEEILDVLKEQIADFISSSKEAAS